MVKSHIRLWLIMIFLAMLTVPALITPDEARARIQAELKSSVQIFGRERVAELAKTADQVYRSVAASIGLERLINKGYVKRKDLDGQLIARDLNTEMSTRTNSYLEALLIQIYGVFFRGALLMHWFMYIGVFIVAAAFDGYTQKKVKQDTIQLMSPWKFSLAMNALVATLFAPLVYMVLPMEVTPWFMPIWAAIAAYPLSVAIANTVRTS